MFDSVIIISTDDVVWDYCNEDFTNDPRTGGFLFGSYACGPCCADRMLKKIKGYNEERYIKAVCPPDISFSNWVIRDLR